MSGRFGQASLLATALALGAACDRPAPQPAIRADGPPLRVCLEDRDAPRSVKEPLGGFDVDVMREVAQRIGRPLEPVWIPSEAKVTEIEESTFPVRRLGRGECDAIPSIPGAAALGDAADRVALSRPYYGAGFEWVGGDSLPPQLSALRGHRVTVLSVSPAHQVAAALGIDWRADVSAAEQLRRLDEGGAEVALVFGPSLAPLGRRSRSDFEPPAALRWNYHVGTRRDRPGGLLAEIDGALGELLESGRIEALLRTHGLPEHLPFPEVFDRDRLRVLRESGGSGT